MQDGCGGRKIQCASPDVDSNLINKQAEIYFVYTEPDGAPSPMRYKELIVAILRNNNCVHIQWDGIYLRPRDPEVTQEELKFPKWKKHERIDWRLSDTNNSNNN